MSSALSADVLVVGGGLAGLAAAIASAGCGARTILLEKNSMIGGNVSSSYVHTLCGLFKAPQGDDFVYANPGFSSWFSECLKKEGAALPAETHGRVAVMPIYPPKVAAYAEKLISSFPQLTFIKSANLSALSMGLVQSGYSAANCVSSGQKISIQAKAVIDTSGDAVAGCLAGAELDIPEGEALQNATLIFRVTGANHADLSGYSRLRLSAAIARGSQIGDLPKSCESIFVRPGEAGGEAYISLNLPKQDDREFNPTNNDFMSQYKVQAEQLALKIIEFLRTHVAGWNDCKLLAMPETIGVRESRRLVGQYVLSELDILSGARFDDQIACSTWPVELWDSHYHASFQYPEKECEIPLRALISRSNPGLGMAGRCMSGSHEALGALRVLGTAMATGEAIGITAAIATDRGVTLDGVSAEEVRKRRLDLLETVYQT